MFTALFLYLCLFIYSIIFSILYNSYGTFLLSFLLGSVPLVSFLLGWIQHFFISAQMEETIGMVEKGENAEVTFRVTNKSIFPVSEVRIVFNYRSTCLKAKKDYVSLSLKARSREKAILRIPAEFCGPISVEAKGYYIFDALHLSFLYKKVKKRDRMEAKCRFYVIPKLEEVPVRIPVPRLAEAEESSLYSKVKRGDDPSEIFDIREYQEGDKIHRIHWKLSSKRNTYMVKDFSLPISTSTCILVSLCIGDGTDGKKKYTGNYDAAKMLDERLSRAILFSYTLIQHDFVHQFFWADAVTSELFSQIILDHDHLLEMIQNIYESGLSTENPLPDLFCQNQHHFRGELYLFGPGKEELMEMGYEPKEVEFDEA